MCYKRNVGGEKPSSHSYFQAKVSCKTYCEVIPKKRLHVVVRLQINEKLDDIDIALLNMYERR